ncbi:MAG TPA: PDZ domain-containing protein, partial [Planctomycetia bacterium]|nr:PDZ domain-containing protein [Planctomycetia bacterium]
GAPPAAGSPAPPTTGRGAPQPPSAAGAPGRGTPPSNPAPGGARTTPVDPPAVAAPRMTPRTGTVALAPPGMRPMLGVTVTPIEEWHRSIYALGDVQGVFVAQVTPGAPADKAGIKVNDVIQAIEGEAITLPSQVAANVQSRRDGDAVTVRIVRGGQTYDVRTVARAPQATAGRPFPEGAGFADPRAANGYSPNAAETALRNEVKKLEDQVKDLEAKLRQSEAMKNQLEERVNKLEAQGSSTSPKSFEPPPVRKNDISPPRSKEKEPAPPRLDSKSDK